MFESLGYIINRRPFRESSLLLDILTEEYGRICCVARPAKKRGKIVKGDLEPFRLLKLQWLGKGDVQTLTAIDEKGRHEIPPSELMVGLYLNELLLLLTRQHVPQPELFSAYKFTLHKLHDAEINRQILMRFEIFILNVLGYPLDESVISKDDIDNNREILRFNLEEGLTQITEKRDHSIIQSNSNIPISADLFLALQDIQNMQESHWKELRIFLDEIFQILANKTINSRKFLSF